ncbi:MAG: DUF881 domain-containing protein [Betaproteobacteria bacterium]
MILQTLSSSGGRERCEGRGRILRLLLVCAAILIVLDTVALARRMSLFRFPGEMDDLEMVRRGGYAVAVYLRSVARKADVEDVPYVNDALSRLDAAIGLAASPAEVARALCTEAGDVQEAISFARAGFASWSKGEQERQVRQDIQRLQEEVRAQREELVRMREAAGMAELIGPGVVVRAYDAEDGYRSREIVHERDIKEILNLLFDAGARGAEVGGQRIVAQSSVRCAGPVILVNQKPIPVNPVVIKAVGDPKALRRALADIEARFARDGKKIDVTDEATVTLAAYDGR